MDCCCGSAECTCQIDAATQTDCTCFACRGLASKECSLCGFQIPAIHFSEEAVHLDKKPDACRCFLPTDQDAITSLESQASDGRESVNVLTSTPIIERSKEGIPSNSLWLKSQVEPCSQIKTTELSPKLTTTFELSSKTEKDISLTENLTGISNYDLVSAGNETEERNVLQRINVSEMIKKETRKSSKASSDNKCLEEEHREGNEYTEEDGNSNECTEEDGNIDECTEEYEYTEEDENSNEYTKEDENRNEYTEEYEYTEEDENSNEYTKEDENRNEYTEEVGKGIEYTEEVGKGIEYTEEVGKSIEYGDVVDGNNSECLEEEKGSNNERIEEEEINSKDSFEEEVEDRNIGESIEEDNIYSNEHLEKDKHEHNNENMVEEKISIPNTEDRNGKENKVEDRNVREDVEKTNEIPNNAITKPPTGTVYRHPHQRRDGAAPFYPPEDGLVSLPFPPLQAPFPRCYRGPFSRNYKAPFSSRYQTQFPLISQNPRMIVPPRLPKFRNPSQLSSRRPIAPQDSTIDARRKVEGWLITQDFQSHSADEQPQIPPASNFRVEDNKSNEKDSFASNERKHQKSPKPYKGNNPNSGR